MAFLVVGWIILWYRDVNFGQLFTDHTPHVVTLWMLGALCLTYVAWLVLYVRHWVTAVGATGFLISVVGLELRFWGDMLLTLDPPFDFPNFTRITAVQAYDPDQLDLIIGTARHGGLAAYVLGLVLTVAFGAVDFQARYRIRKRRFAKAINWPRWF